MQVPGVTASKGEISLLRMGVSSVLAAWQLIGLLKYARGSIWDSLGRMFNSPMCSIITVEKECERVDVALHGMAQWAQGHFILIVLEVFCNPNDCDSLSMMSCCALKAEPAHPKPSPKSKAHLWALFLHITHSVRH